MSAGFFQWITPSAYRARADRLGLDDPRSLAELRELAARDEPCAACGQPAWRLVGIGLCFTCITGQAYCGDDFELIPEGDDA